MYEFIDQKSKNSIYYEYLIILYGTMSRKNKYTLIISQNSRIIGPLDVYYRGQKWK